MVKETKRPPIVQAGEVKTIVATGVIAIDRGNGYVQVTFCHDQMWGADVVQEREITGRVMMTLSGWEEFQRVAATLGIPIEREAGQAVH